MAEPPDLILHGVRPWGEGEPVSVAVAGGRIAAIGVVEGPGQDWGGRALLPGLVEPHVHLDKTLSLGAGGLENDSGTLGEAIERWHASKPGRTVADYGRRAEAALRLALSRGVTHLRTHVDVSAGDLRGVEALLALRERWRGRVEVQLVALGLPGSPAEDAANAEALRLGVDVVGASPNHAPEPLACIAAAFRLAGQFGRPLDLHIDENERPESRYLEVIAGRAGAADLGGRVTADHGCSLAYQPPGVQAHVIGAVAASGINVVSLPVANLVLQGHGQPAARGLTPIRALLAAGVNVALGSDNVRDPFVPLGNYDPLLQASLAVNVAHLTRPAERREALRLVTTRAARVLGLPEYGLEVGCPADLVLLDAASPDEILSELPARLRVYRAGREVYREEVSRTWT